MLFNELINLDDNVREMIVNEMYHILSNKENEEENEQPRHITLTIFSLRNYIYFLSAK